MMTVKARLYLGYFSFVVIIVILGVMRLSRVTINELRSPLTSAKWSERISYEL